MVFNRHSFVFLLLASLSFAPAGCGPTGDSEEDFEYSEADMRSIAVGAFQGEMTLNGKPKTTFDLVLSQPPPGPKPACASRTFAEPQCFSMSSLTLNATLTSADGTFKEAKLKGDFIVGGLTLEAGELDLSGDNLTIHAPWKKDAAFQVGTINGAMEGTFTLQKKP